MTSNLDNLRAGTDSIEFFVWIDPKSATAAHNLKLTGKFFSVPLADPSKLLPFLPNPNYKDVFVSPFSSGLMRPYVAEYNLELARSAKFSSYPSRLNAIFLLSSREEAEKYRERNPDHVGRRILKTARTCGHYVLSEHDSNWIEFLRLDHSLDEETTTLVSEAYWRGLNVESTSLMSRGTAWTARPIREVLYHGQIEFADRSLETL